MKKIKIGDIVEIHEGSIGSVVTVTAKKVGVKFIHDEVYGEAIREYSKKYVKHYKYQIGDLVIYDGLIGEILYVTKLFNLKEVMFGLSSIKNEEITCTALESKCEPYTAGIEIDQSEALFEAQASSQRIANIGDSLTDKYFRDGCH